MTDKKANGSWEKSKSKLKQKFADLTNNDQMLLERKKEAILARLQLKLGTTKEEALKIISGLF